MDPSQLRIFPAPVLSHARCSSSLSFCGKHGSMSEFSVVSLTPARHPEDSTKISTCFGRDLPLEKDPHGSSRAEEEGKALSIIHGGSKGLQRKMKAGSIGKEGEAPCGHPDLIPWWRRLLELSGTRKPPELSQNSRDSRDSQSRGTAGAQSEILGQVWDPSPAPMAREAPNIPEPRPPQAGWSRCHQCQPCQAQHQQPQLLLLFLIPEQLLGLGRSYKTQQGINPPFPSRGIPNPLCCTWNWWCHPSPSGSRFQIRIPSKPGRPGLKNSCWDITEGCLGKFKCGGVVIPPHPGIPWEAPAGFVPCQCPSPCGVPSGHSSSGPAGRGLSGSYMHNQ